MSVSKKIENYDTGQFDCDIKTDVADIDYENEQTVLKKTKLHSNHRRQGLRAVVRSGHENRWLVQTSVPESRCTSKVSAVAA